jgi:hypothetical protein
VKLKKIIVWSLEYACGLNDLTLGRIPVPASWWDKDWRWMRWVYGCRLATLSAELDERWGTGIWMDPPK